MSGIRGNISFDPSEKPKMLPEGINNSLFRGSGKMVFHLSMTPAVVKWSDKFTF